MAETRRSSAETRERLLEVADNLFYSDGIRAVGIDRLLAESGVSKTSLYQHFASKDALIAAYLHRRIDQSNAQLNRLLTTTPGEPGEGVVAYFELLGRWMTGPSFRGCPFINAAAEFPDADHPAHRAVTRHRDLVRARLEDLVAPMNSEDPGTLVAALMMLYDGALVAADLGSSEVAARTLVETAERLLATARPVQKRPRRADRT